MDVLQIYDNVLNLLLMISQVDKNAIVNNLDNISEDTFLEWLIRNRVGSYNIFSNECLLKNLIYDLKQRIKENK